METIYNARNAIKSIIDVPISSEISQWTNGFNDLNKSAKTTTQDFENLYSQIKNPTIKTYLQDIQAQGQGATASVDGLYSSLMGNAKGYSNVKKAIQGYNQSVQLGAETQQQWVSAVNGSNDKLGKYLTNLNGAKASMSGYAGSLLLSTAKTIGLNIVTTALSATLSMGLTVAISALVSSLASWIEGEVKAAENASKMADEAKQASEDISDLASQYYKLSEAVKSDGSQKEALTKVTQNLLAKLKLEGESIDYLVKKYGSLDNAIKTVTFGTLKDAQSALGVDLSNKENAVKGFLSWDNTLRSNAGYNGNGSFSKTLETIKSSGILGTNKGYTPDTLVFKNDFSSIENARKNYDDLSAALTLLEKTYGDVDSAKDEFYQTLNARKGELKTLIDEYDSAALSFNQNIIQQNVLTKMTGQALPETEEEFNNFITSIVNSTSDLAGITNDDFDSIKGAVESVLMSMPEFSSFFEQEIVETANNTHTALETLKSDFATLQETFNGTLSNQSTFQTALDKIAEGTALTTDEVNKLVALYPELASTFTQTADGWTTSADNIISANKDIVKSTKDSINAQIEGIQELYAQRDEIMADSSTSYGEKRDLVAALGIDEAEKQLPVLNLMLKMLNANTSSSTDTLAELQAKFDDTAKSVNTLSGNFKTLSSAFAEYNENGTISIDTALGLIDAGYAAVVSFNAETGAIELNKNAYIQLANAKIEEQEVSLKLGLNAAQEEKFNTEHEIVANLGWGYLGATESKLMMGKANAKLANNTELIASYEAEIQTLETLKGSIDSVLTGDYGNSSKSTDNSDPWKDEFDKAYAEKQHLLTMGQINETEYLNWLENAYKTYFADVSKYQEEYWKYEEEVFTKRAKLVEDSNKAITDSFEKTKDGYSDLVDDNSVKSMEKYVEKWKELVNSTYAGKPEFSDEYIAEMKAISEYEEKITEKRVNNEIKYWENQKKKAEKNYQDQIDEIEKLADAEDKLAKKEQLRLDILEAEKKLLDAKNNKNQLIFANGKIDYDVDQEAVLSAEKELTSANKSYQDELIQEQVDILKEKKEQDSADFDTIIDVLNAYKDKETPVTESDSTVVNDAINSEYGQAVVKQAAEDKELSIEEYITSLGGVWDKDKFDNLIGGVRQISANVEKSFEGITKSVVNNQNINNNANNQSVTMGDVHITVQGSTSDKMLDEFASKLGTKIRELTQKNFSN